MARHSILLSPVLRRMITKPFVKVPPGIQILAGRWDDQPLDDDDEQVERGGPGSGHFDHAGRPGERGGSLPGDAQATGEAAVAGTATRQSRVTHDRAFYVKIADDAHERFVTIRKANEEKYGWNREQNIGSRRGTTNTNAAFRWLQDRLGPGIMVYRGKGIDPSWTDSVSGRTSSALFAREEATGNEVLIAINEGQLDWHPDEIHITHLFAVTQGTGLGTRVMEALRDYSDLTQKPLYVDMVANVKYFSGLGWMEPNRNYVQRLAWAHDPHSPEAQPDPRPLTFVYRPPLVSKEYTAIAMASAATDNGAAEWEAGLAIRGGPGSGHFEHAGIPGHRGGSLPGEAGQAGEGRPGGGTAKPTPRIVVSDRVNSHLFGVPGEKALPEYLKAAWAKAAQDCVNRFADQTNYYPDDVLITNDTVLFLEGSTVEDPAHEAGYLESIILGAHNEDVGSIWMQDVRGPDFMPNSVKWHQGLYHELGHWAANKVIGKAHYEEVVPQVPITYSEPLRRNYDYESEATIRSEYIADLFSDYVSLQTGLAPEGATGPVFRRLDSKPWTEEDVSNFQTITRVMAEAQDATRKAGGKALRQRATSASVLVIYNIAEEAFVMPADEAPEPVEGRVTVLPLVGSAVERGGPGSGHHGHAGIPGHQGGSLPGEGGQAEQAPEEHYGGYKIQHGTLGLAKGKVALVIPGGGNTNWHNTLDEALKQAKVWDAERQESIKLKVIRDAAVETVKAGSATNEDLRVWAGGLKEWQNAVGTDKATGMLRDLGLKAVEAKRLLYKTPSGISSGGYDIYFLEEIYAAYKRQYGPAVERFDISPVLRRLITKGGPGSGHHGHAGIPGHQGGSLPGEAGQAGEEHEGGGSQTSDRVNTSHLSKLGVTASNADVQGLVAALKGIPDNESIPSAERRGTHYYPAEEVESELNASWREFWLAPDGSAFAVGESGHDWAAAKALAEHYYRQHNDEFLPRMTLSMHPSGMAYLTMRAPIRGDIPVDIAEGTPKNNGDFDWSGWGFTQMGTTGPTPTPEEIIALNPTAAYEGLVRRASTGTEETLAAYGFVRVSRGGSKSDAAAGVSWDATLPPTQKQKDALSSVVSSVQANGGSILWETLNQTSKEFGVEGDAKDTDGYSAFWSAIDGDYVAALAKRTKPIPELAMRFLIRRGGPGSGHFGHAGRPGERGGSLPGEAGQAGEESPSSLGGRVHSEAMTAHIGAIRVTSADSDGVLDALHQNRNLYSTKTEQNEWVARGAEVWLAPSGEVFDVERSNGHARVASLALSSHYATRVDDFAPYLTLRPFTDEELMLIANRPPSERALYNHLSIEIPGRGLIDLSMSRPGKEGGLEWMWGLDLPMGQTPMNPDPIDVMKLDPGRMLGELWYPDDRDHDSEVIMAAHGFVRISRGGAAGSKTVGITWDAALSPTKAQQDVLSAAVAPIQANEDAQLVYETVNNTATHPGAEGIARFEDDYPDFWNAIEGKTRVAQSLAVRSTMPEWALKFLIPRGGPGSGHFGHLGRPGERGGSLPGEGTTVSEAHTSEWIRPASPELTAKVKDAITTKPYTDAANVTYTPVGRKVNGLWDAAGGSQFMSPDGEVFAVYSHWHAVDAVIPDLNEEMIAPGAWRRMVDAIPLGRDEQRAAGLGIMYSMGWLRLNTDKTGLWVELAKGQTLTRPQAEAIQDWLATDPNELTVDVFDIDQQKQVSSKGSTATSRQAAANLLGLTARGGPGSGHFGHVGRPGERGGSLPGDASATGEERPQPGEMLHKWELAGLGTRPYRLVDFWSAPDRGLLEANPIAYNAAWAEHPPTTNNVFGSCEYCGTPITNHYVIQSDDKRRFCVGSECVRKTGDAGLVNALKRYEAKERQAESQERYVRQVEEGKALLETHRAALSALPHPNAGMARSGRTLYDYYRWGIAEQHFGKSGTASGIRNIKKAVGLTSRGGEGSGHYGHAGIPGHQGGSLPGEAGQAGEEVAGTSADYLGDNASKLPGVPLSIEWHHPESEKPGADFQPLLYHGTVLDHVQDIARDGLLPQVGEWVSDAYARKLEAGEQAIPAVYFAGPTSAEYAEADTRITPADDSYAWKAIMAIEAQVGFLMGKEPKSVTVDDIYQNGLMIGVSAETMRDKSLNVVQETIETDETFSVPVSVVGPEDMLVGGEKEVVEYLGPERGDFFTHDKVEPTAYLYGGNLVRWMADWVRRYSDIPKGEYPEDELAGEYAEKWAIQWESELYDHEALLDDFPGEQENIEEQSLARRVDAAVLRALFETPLATLVSRRIFIPQWLIERGGPGSGHFGHEGIPGHRGGSLPGEGGAQDTRVGITGQHSEEKLGARIVPDWQLKKEMEALRGELVDAGVQGVRVEMGRGGYQGGWEQSWVLSYKGVSDAAKRILAETAAKYGQDSFVVFEPPTEGNSHAASNLSLDIDGMDPTVVANIEARLTEHNFGGWTWSEVDGKPRLQLNVVPEFGGDDQKHPAMVAALETDLKELGIKYQRDDWRAAVTAVGPGVKVEYQTYLESLRGRSLTGYRQGYIIEDQKGVDHGNLEGVGGAGAAGVAGEGVAGGNGEVQRVAGVASEGVAEPGAVGRQPGDFHSQAGVRAGVVVTPVLRLVRRGGPGSGHFGHEGIPQHRGGSLPGAGPTKEELQRASRFYDKRKADYHSRFDAMVARHKAIDEKALAHARPDVEGLAGDWAKAVALKLLEGPTYSGNVKAMAADIKRFAAGTLAWLRKEKPSETLRPEELRQAIGTLEHVKAAMEYWIRVDEPERAMESAASFVTFDLQSFVSQSGYQGLLKMIDANGNVDLTHPAVVNMMEAGGVREQAITRILGLTQEYSAERSAYLQAGAEIERGTAEVDAFFERAPQVMADVSPVGMSVAAVTAPKVALDTALGTQETTRLAYHDAIHALTVADQDKTMPQEDVFRIAEACDYALEAYQNAQRDVATLNIVGHDEAKEIVNAALLTADAANVEVLLDASTSMLWTAGQRDAQRLYAREAQTWLTEHADASIFPSTDPMLVTVKNTDSDVDSRASYSNNNINGKAGMDTATYLHELGHWVEDHNEGIHESAVAFLRSRTAGESTQPLRKVTGDWGYDPWELTRKDEFSSAYVGKIYGQSYTATEVVSMGIQRLYQNPSYFQREDPEHFDFTVALLRGLWNKPTP